MLEVRSLSARRGGQIIFWDLSFALAAGAALLVKGPNGSGKSSLLRALAGLLDTASGEILWQGKNIATDWSAHRARIAVIGHLDALKSELSVAETLRYWRALCGVTGRGRDTPSSEKSAAYLGPLRLEHLADTKVRYLSAGQKRRLALSRLLLTDAPLWFLDEPAAALDGEGQMALATMIKGHRAKGGAAVVVTHHADIEDAQILRMGMV